MEIKLTSVDFSCLVAEDSRSSWLQTLGNQFIDRSPYIRYTNRKYYCIILFENFNESQMNVHTYYSTFITVPNSLVIPCLLSCNQVYAVELSSMATQARRVVESNSLGHVIEVMQSEAEEVDLPEKVDVIISEWMGTMLVVS